MLPSPLRLCVLVAPLVLPLVACGGSEPATEGSGDSGPAPAAELDVDAAIAVFEAGTCWTCHGRPHMDMDGFGGPKLAGLDAHWNVADLADFIENPEAWVAKDSRLALLKSEAMVPMNPPPRPISLEDRELLARWLLTLE
ncbi:c-type cytochrome [Engelhardtia mirabilis]|uniref:Cytochrome c n=1 Tax=Engelhardtia mirabilis TaxID=2528011 RepID=A0A518BQU1_9BACT|nr:Cytochrome c [Planctomycetes bacterium Pla133]QDV03668.1 Cytochrome c [Planctomycetes bacterium Pla86]